MKIRNIEVRNIRGTVLITDKNKTNEQYQPARG